LERWRRSPWYEDSSAFPVPESLDDVTAAAIANPGMSAWSALTERAHLQEGETVLVNGATGSADRLAAGIARHLGAGKIIATGRNETELRELLRAGADVVIPFSPGTFHPLGGKKYEQALKSEFSGGIHVVVDYLWGESARAVIAAIAETVEDATPVRFVHTGGASGEASIDLPGAALRSSSIQLMGSGIKSRVPAAHSKANRLLRSHTPGLFLLKTMRSRGPPPLRSETAPFPSLLQTRPRNLQQSGVVSSPPSSTVLLKPGREYATIWVQNVIGHAQRHPAYSICRPGKEQSGD
jgi:threonine dehydrogenase-like Zn-dependent dehydrogenase